MGVPSPDDIGEVAALQHGVAVGDEGKAVAQQGHHAHLQLGVHLRQPAHIVSHHRRAGLETDDVHRQQATAEVEKLGGHGVVEQVGNLLGGDAFGADHLVHAQLAEHVAVLGGEEFGIGDAGYRLLGFQLLGEDAGDQVDALVVEHGEEEVAVPHIGVAQHLRRGGVAGDGEQVVLALQSLEELRVRVDHGDVVVQFGERLGQVHTHLAVACYDDIHTFFISKNRAAKIRKFFHIECKE